MTTRHEKSSRWMQKARETEKAIKGLGYFTDGWAVRVSFGLKVKARHRYSRSPKPGRGGHRVDLTVPSSWLEHVHGAGLAVLAGMLVLGVSTAPPTPQGMDRALYVWAAHDQGTTIQSWEGYVVEYGGRWYPGYHLDDAVREALTDTRILLQLEEEQLPF